MPPDSAWNLQAQEPWLVAQVFWSFRRVPPITGRDFMDKLVADALFLQRTTACFSNV